MFRFEVELVVDPYRSVEVSRAKLETPLADSPHVLRREPSLQFLWQHVVLTGLTETDVLPAPNSRPEDSPPFCPYPQALIARFHPTFLALFS